MRPVAVALLLLSGCRSAAQLQGRMDSPAGCYALDIGEWSQPWPSGWQPPEVIRLDTLPVAHGTGFLLRPRAGLPATRSDETSSWREVSSDSIGLYWSGDYVGLNMFLERRGDELSGWVRGFTDVVRPAEMEPQASVQGRRVECPASLQPAHRANNRLQGMRPPASERIPQQGRDPRP